MGAGDDDRGSWLISIGFSSFAGTGYLIEHVQQLSDRSHREGDRAQFVRIELEVGSRNRDVAFHMLADPHHAAPAEIGLLGDANQW
jgi:hypothetical protein